MLFCQLFIMFWDLHVVMFRKGGVNYVILVAALDFAQGCHTLHFQHWSWRWILIRWMHFVWVNIKFCFRILFKISWINTVRINFLDWTGIVQLIRIFAVRLEAWVLHKDWLALLCQSKLPFNNISHIIKEWDILADLEINWRRFLNHISHAILNLGWIFNNFQIM